MIYYYFIDEQEVTFTNFQDALHNAKIDKVLKFRDTQGGEYFTT